MTRGLSLAIAALSLPPALVACAETTGDRAGSGAAIGAASGAVIGAVTPIGPLGRAAIGAAAGAVDGRLGPRTEEAIRHYQQDNGLAADGQPSAALWDRIHSRVSG